MKKGNLFSITRRSNQPLRRRIIAKFMQKPSL
jgi:hypothetical protein